MKWVLNHILKPTLATSTHWLMILSLKWPYFNSKQLKKNKTSILLRNLLIEKKLLQVPLWY